MSLKLTAESFLAGVKQSGLTDSDTLETLVKTLRGEGVDTTNSAVLADALITKGHHSLAVRKADAGEVQGLPARPVQAAESAR